MDGNGARGNVSPVAPLSDLLRDEAQFGMDALLRTPRCVETGFPALDRILGGGLSPGLTVLGASPGLGKSTLALNIARYAAAGGCPVRYYSYEMPPARLGMKLIVRHNFLAGGQPLFSTKDLFDTRRMRDWPEGREAYRRARRQAAGELENLYIVDCNAGQRAFTADDIADDFRRFMDRRGDRPGLPLLIVDYLQVLPLDPAVRVSDARQAVDHNVRKMTALSKSFGGVPVLLISALGRASYHIPVQIDSFKESGSIEFSADTLLGIQFSACQNRDGSPNREWNMNREKDRSPREMDLVVLKQRYGETGKVPFLYYAAYDCFLQGDTPRELLPPAPPPRDVPAEEGPREIPGQGTPAEPLRQEPPAPSAPPETSRPEASGPAAPAEAVREEAPGRGAELERACLNNTLVAHDLREGARPGEARSCLVLPALGIHTVYQVSAPLSWEDCDVADGLYSLFLSQRHFAPGDGFTLRRLLTVLTGDEHQTLTPQKRDALLASLARLEGTELTLDCGAELEARGKGRKYRPGDFNVPRPFLRLAREGRRLYFPSTRLLEVLPLYEYASLTGQVVSFPARLLDTRDQAGRKALSDTAEAIAVKHFLLYRLEVVRNRRGREEHSRMRTVSFTAGSQLLRHLRLEREAFTRAQWSRQCRRVSQLVLTTLDCFRRVGYIQNFTLREGTSVTVTGPVADPWTLDYGG